MPNSESTLNDLIRRAKESIRKHEDNAQTSREFLAALETELEQLKREKVNESSGDSRVLLNG